MHPDGAASRTAPLSFAQERLWFLDRLNPGLPDYIFHRALGLRGRLRYEVLKRAARDVVRRHEPLRATFAEVDGVPVQRIASVAAPAWRVVDLCELAASAAQGAMRRLFYEDTRRAFDLTAGPVLRLTLVRLQEDEHVLVLGGHHIIGDGGSIQIFFTELGELYNAFCHDRKERLPELRIGYTDFVVTQRQRLQGAALKRLVAYWEGRLADAPPPVNLAPDRRLPEAPTHAGANLPFSLSQPCVSALKALARRERATLFMVVLAAFQALLARYTSQHDMLIGVPVAGRHVPGTGDLIGLFVNTLLVRTDTSGNPTFRALLGRARTAALEAFAHQDLPLHAIVKALPGAHTLADSPFHVMFAFNDFGPPVVALTGLECAQLEMPAATLNHYLVMDLAETSDGTIAGLCNYSSELFEADTIRRLLGHYVAYLTVVAADPDERIMGIELLTPSEKEQLQSWSSGPAADYGEPRCLHHLFEARSQASADAIAVVCGENHLSFAELSARATRVADHLRARQIGADAFVGIYLARSADMVIAMLGVLEAGAAYVPIDPRYPRTCVAQMIADGAVTIVLSDTSSQREISGLCEAILLVEELSRPTHGMRQGAMAAVCPDNAAYVIYTSGTTGTPKGIIVSHGAICNHMRWMQSTFPLSEQDAVLQRTPVSFDASIWEIYAPLLSGARLVLARTGGDADTAHLAALMAEQQVTVAQFVPSLLEHFVEEAGVVGCTALRRLFCGGEALEDNLRRRVGERTQAALINLYGPAEATIDATYWTCLAGDGRQRVPIGRPVSNCHTLVLDAHLRQVPIGVPGELYISGAGLARGYHHQPRLTAETFVPNPFAAERGQRMYKTNDVVRYRTDGSLEFLGRADEQVKLRGCRVELGAIEAALRAHPSVREAAAILCRDGRGPTVVAFFAADASVTATDIDMRRFVADRLPEYMVPARVQRLNAIPTMPNGKRDRRALEALGAIGLERAAPAEPPRTPLEEEVASMWRRLLGRDDFGIHDNFFELGGHSLLLIQLSASVRTTFAVDVPLRTLFNHPTIAEVAMQIVDAQLQRHEPDEIAAMIADVSRLSPEEARVRLAIEHIDSHEELPAAAAPA